MVNSRICTTVTLEGKITVSFAPPEVVPIAKGLIMNLKLKLISTAVDTYCWAMSFFALLVNRRDNELVKNYEKYKMGTEKDYERYMKIIEAAFNSTQTADSRKEKCIRRLLSKPLRYRPEERPKRKI